MIKESLSKQQIIELDRKVIDYSVDRIIVEISQYLEYKNTINTRRLIFFNCYTYQYQGVVYQIMRIFSFIHKWVP